MAEPSAESKLFTHAREVVGTVLIAGVHHRKVDYEGAPRARRANRVAMRSVRFAAEITRETKTGRRPDKRLAERLAAEIVTMSSWALPRRHGKLDAGHEAIGWFDEVADPRDALWSVIRGAAWGMRDVGVKEFPEVAFNMDEVDEHATTRANIMALGDDSIRAFFAEHPAVVADPAAWTRTLNGPHTLV